MLEMIRLRKKLAQAVEVVDKARLFEEWWRNEYKVEPGCPYLKLLFKARKEFDETQGDG